MTIKKWLMAATMAASLFALPAAAQGWYVAGSASWIDQDKSGNSGVTTRAFQTGNGAPVRSPP